MKQGIARYLEENPQRQSIAMTDFSDATITLEAPWSTRLDDTTITEQRIYGSFLDVDPESVANATVVFRTGRAWEGATVTVHNDADAAEDLLLASRTGVTDTVFATLSQDETVTVRCAGDGGDTYVLISPVGTST